MNEKITRYAIQYRTDDESTWETLDRFYFAATSWDRWNKERIIANDPGNLFKSRYNRGTGEYRVITLATGAVLAA